MMETNNENSEGLQIEGMVCFEPDLTRFEYLCRNHFLAVIQRLESLSAWNRIPSSDDFYNFCVRCLRIYSHLCLSDTFARLGFRTESLGKLRATTGSITLPTYILGMIREICRPMYTKASVTVAAYMRLDAEQGIGPVPGLGWNNSDQFFSALFSRNSSNLDVSSMIDESPTPAPIFVSTDRSFAYANGSTPPLFRIESMNALRHLRPHAILYLGYGQVQQAPALLTAAAITNVNTVAFQGFDEPAAVAVNQHNLNPNAAPAGQVLFYDARGTRRYLADVCCYHATTTDMTTTVAATINGANVQVVRPVVQPPADMAYGLLGAELVHRLIRALNPIENELADRLLIRARLCLGNAFTFHSRPYHNFFDTAFPSAACPSVVKVTHNELGKKPPRKKRKGKKEEKNKDDDDESQKKDTPNGG